MIKARPWFRKARDPAARTREIECKSFRQINVADGLLAHLSLCVGGGAMKGGKIANIVMGLAAIVAGSVPLLVRFFSTAPRPAMRDPAPDWIGFLIAAMFIAAGAMAIVNSFEGADPSGELSSTAPRTLRTIYKLTGTLIALALAVLITWVSIGPGERHFTGTGSFGPFGVGDMFGRMVFGIGALMAWCIIGAMAMRAMKSAKQSD
jgi:hypothetical protein